MQSGSEYARKVSAQHGITQIHTETAEPIIYVDDDVKEGFVS
jgi:hypothetical protein